jgi:nitrogen fixation protein NifU and related proteins
VNDPLYQAEILELAKQGRSIGRLESPTVSARVDNPICGDRITVDLAITEDRITDVGAKVQGCALCQAAAAIIAIESIGTDVDQLTRVRDSVAAYLAGTTAEAALPWTRLANFAPVRDARSRHDCVLLPFKAAANAVATLETVNS